MKEDKIIIKRSPNADTRTSKGDITKKELLQQTYSHIDDVNNVGAWLVDKFKEQIKNHDHTKVEGINSMRILQQECRMENLKNYLGGNYI